MCRGSQVLISKQRATTTAATGATTTAGTTPATTAITAATSATATARASAITQRHTSTFHRRAASHSRLHPHRHGRAGVTAKRAVTSTIVGGTTDDEAPRGDRGGRWRCGSVLGWRYGHPPREAVEERQH